MKRISRIVATLILCAAAPLFGAISLVAHTSAASSGGALSLTTGSVNTAGANFIVIAVSFYNNIAQTVSDSNSNTWTALTQYGSGNNIRLFYCISCTVGSGHTFTTTSSSSSYQAIAVEAFSGVANNPFDVQNGGGTFTTCVCQPGSITPSQNGELIISAIVDGSTTSVSVDSSMTITDQQFYSNGNALGGALAYLVQPAAAAINPSWTSAGSASVTVAAFKAAPSLGVQLISSGTAAMGTAAVSSGACAPPVTASAFGVAISDAIIYNTNTNPTTVTGYAPSSSGSLYIWAFPSANNVNFVVCNPSSSSITPGALSLNWQVIR